MYGFISDVLRKKDVSDGDVFVMKKQIVNYELCFKFILLENEEMYNDFIGYSNKIVELEEEIQRVLKENVNMKVELYDV